MEWAILPNELIFSLRLCAPPRQPAGARHAPAKESKSLTAGISDAASGRPRRLCRLATTVVQAFKRNRHRLPCGYGKPPKAPRNKPWRRLVRPMRRGDVAPGSSRRPCRWRRSWRSWVRGGGGGAGGLPVDRDGLGQFAQSEAGEETRHGAHAQARGELAERFPVPFDAVNQRQAVQHFRLHRRDRDGARDRHGVGGGGGGCIGRQCADGLLCQSVGALRVRL